MRKKIIIISLIIFILCLGIFLGKIFNKEEVSLSSDLSIKEDNMLSMMVEQTAGVGDYVKTEADSWPSDGYVFNTTLSKCKNGGEVSWDDENNAVLFAGANIDECFVYFDKYSLIKISNYSIASSGNSIIITINANSGTGAISKYYYSKDGGATYIESTSDTYTFTGLSKGTYNIKAYVLDSNNKSSSTISKSIEITTIPFATYIKSLYTGVQGENSLYHHDGTLTNGIDDNSYRYAGASNSVNNYVCFGSDAESCPTDNLYRIIGVFDDQVKLIKSTKATSVLLGTDGDYYSDTAYYWNYKQNTSTNSGNGSNTWSTSLLNKTNLNTNYINNIKSTWASKIAQTTWKVGGNTGLNIYNQIPSVAYQNEIVNPVTTNSTDNAMTYSAKIGLMYVSDYGFAAEPNAWTLTMISYNDSIATSSNWILLGIHEWTLTRRSDYPHVISDIGSDGNVSNWNGDHASNNAAVRPVFYLNSSVTYLEGTGTSSNPYRIN